MSDAYDLRLLGTPPADFNPHRYATPEETQRLVDACLATDRHGDAGVAEFEAAVAARRAAKRRSKRAVECAEVAVLCFGGMALLVGPTVITRWPLESLLLALVAGA
jgi:hypothetical protein